MIRFELAVIGQNAVQNALRTTAAQAPKRMGDITYRWAQGVRATLKSTPYPAKRPGQKYVRTGQLANRWAVERRSQSQIVIVNRAQHKGRGYSRFVVGDSQGEGQAWFHRGRWWTGRSVVQDARPELRAAINKELSQMLRARGTG